VYALRQRRFTTTGRLFHRCKFPLLKAFYIVYYVSTGKNGMSSTEMIRKQVLRQNTSWLFKQKVMKAMESSGSFPMSGKVNMNKTYVGGQDEQTIGNNKGKKNLVVLAIERKGKEPRLVVRVSFLEKKTGKYCKL
jgi:hypothetical protein